MGSLHATLTLPLVPELLAIHPFFDTPEQNVDDPACKKYRTSKNYTLLVEYSKNNTNLFQMSAYCC